MTEDFEVGKKYAHIHTGVMYFCVGESLTGPNKGRSLLQTVSGTVTMAFDRQNYKEVKEPLIGYVVVHKSGILRDIHKSRDAAEKSISFDLRRDEYRVVQFKEVV